MEIRQFQPDIFNLFDRHWALVTAGDAKSFNSMTISWGSLGTIWGAPGNGRPIVTIYINPLRYTCGILQNSSRFTVSFFDERYRKNLVTMGSRSGRDVDKVSLTKLTPMKDGDYVTYHEARYTFECRKLCQQPLDKKAIPQEIADMFYEEGEDAHWMFIGEVEKILNGENA